MVFARWNELYKYLSQEAYEKLMPFLSKVSENISLGEYEIDHEHIIVRVHHYTTKDPDDCRIEAHDRYVDIQATIKGAEGISIYQRDKLKEETDFDELNDVIFYARGNAIPIAHVENVVGYFSLFEPCDAHRPQERSGEYEDVLKMVIKVEKNLLR